MIFYFSKSMKTNYIKQVWRYFRQDPVVSIVSIIGTALAIFLIMVIVMLQEVKVVPFAPESNRDRSLYSSALVARDFKELGSWSGAFGLYMGKELYGNLKTPETVSFYQAWIQKPSTVSSSGSVPFLADNKGTDANFFKVFDFDFLSGRPFDNSDFESKKHVAVISESVARRLFHSINVVGRPIELDHSEYKVCAVVRDVSTLTPVAYAQIWIPFSTQSDYKVQTISDITDIGSSMGPYAIVILARKTSDFPKIREEVMLNYKRMNAQLKSKQFYLDRMNRPYTQSFKAVQPYENEEFSMISYYYRQGVLILILLLVPAINLSSMTQSRLRRRVSEIGIRRAFGCSRREMIYNIIMENFIFTLIAGLIGLILCVIFGYFFSTTFFDEAFTNHLGKPAVSLKVLLNPVIFLFTLLFCFILNLFSSSIPAWRASRTNIVNAIGGVNH